MERLILSVCIPSYNGGEALIRLLKTLLSSKRQDFEVVVVDDCSRDDTQKFLANLLISDTRLRVEQNAFNLGMDKNFSRVASLAKGEYLWFSGQDDLINPESLELVIEFLLKNRDIEFLLMSHSKRFVTRFGTREVIGSYVERPVFGKGLKSFLQHTNYFLPTFLPTFLIKVSDWRGIDISRYYGTYYCQVGVFLETSQNIRWCHFPGNYVTGLVPSDGWQTDPVSYVNIAFGHFAMLARAAENSSWMSREILQILCLRQRRRLIYSLLLISRHRIQVNASLWEEVLGLISRFRKMSLPIRTVQCTPRIVAALLLALINIRKIFKEWLSLLRGEYIDYR